MDVKHNTEPKHKTIRVWWFRVITHHVCACVCRARDWQSVVPLTTTLCSWTTRSVNWSLCSMIVSSSLLLTGHRHTTYPPATANNSITFKSVFQQFHSLLTSISLLMLLLLLLTFISYWRDPNLRFFGSISTHVNRLRNTALTRKRGNCECIATRGSPTPRSPYPL